MCLSCPPALRDIFDYLNFVFFDFSFLYFISCICYELLIITDESILVYCISLPYL